MGAGRGKTRRAKTLAATRVSPQAIFENVKWHEFLEEGGLTKQKIHQYYLGGKAPNDNDEARMRELVTEIFNDAVAVGAITLPKPYTAADFVFAKAAGRARIILASEPKKEEKIACGYSYLRQNSGLGSGNVSSFLKFVTDALNKLIARA